MTRLLPALLATGMVWIYIRFVHHALTDSGPTGDRRTRAFVDTLAAWTALPLLGGLGVALIAGTGAMGLVAGVVLLGIAAVLLVPWPLATVVAIPQGWPKVAYVLARLSTLRSQPDPVGLAMATAARALLRSPAPNPTTVGWIEAHGHSRSMTPGMVLAHGLLAAHRGNDALARRLLRTVERFDPRAHDDIVITWAREWRAAEAAERGAWSEVVEAAARLGPHSPVLRWLEGVGRRFAGTRDAPSDENLDARWQQVPRQRALSDLHHACLGHPPMGPPHETAREASSPLQAHVDALAHPTQGTLAAALAAWGDAPPDQAQRLPRAVADLALAASEAGLPLPPLPLSIQRHVAATDADDALLRPLELAGQRLTDQLMAPVPIDPIAGLHDWMELDGLLDDIRRRGSPGALRLAFRPAYGPLSALSVALYNDLGEPLLSNALTRWLLDLAREVGDERAAQLQTRNLAATSSP